MSDPGLAPAPPAADELARLRAEHSGAVQALQAAIRDTTRLTRLFAVLSEAAPVPALLERMLATLSELFLADVVVLLDPTRTGGFVPLASIGLPLAGAQRPIPPHTGSHAARALETGQTQVLPDAGDDPAVEDYLRELGVGPVVWLPVAGDQPTAHRVLVLARTQPTPFGRSDVDLLKAMAHRLGLILERADAEQARVRLESQLRQAEKAQSLARMAGAIAHHFNNKLAAVTTSLELARDELPADHPVQGDLERAKDAARRAAETSSLMLAYLGQGGGRREPVHLAILARETLQLLQGRIPPEIRLSSDLREIDCAVLASPPQLSQVLTNLVLNAAEALGTRPGEIVVSIRGTDRDQIPTRRVPAGARLTASQYVCLEVADTGAGMPAETVDMIFDPFFSTKAVGRGLGLPVALGTIRAHDGVIAVDTQEGSGTTVRVYLPRLQPPAAPAEAAPPPATPAIASSARVLIADDEDVIRFTTARVMSRLGYEVATAVDGADAVEQFRAGAGGIRFVVLDLTMPRLDGWAALAAMREIRPGLPAILVSGYEQATAIGAHPLDRLTAFLHKPYELGEFKAAIQRVLAAAEDELPGSPPAGQPGA